ncbi:hypothetical protein [Flavobacterium columnare]|uniref:GAPS4 PD-(D/E)XK nuclease domain-containing protein n=1 Tax=Flavobacterium columnare TaxID=996 RepID=A0AA94F055_9FLAO|nr:hypothetical protein [Flavobacterium columnare]MCH4829157.1 hypothetical protein [Flavobacterium columnare]MCH4833933.1 hypothetical protein [Flavobacterium columnare]
MGEKSKRSGEHGEEIIEKFLRDIIGYDTIQTGVEIDCVYKKKHSKTENRQTHGADVIIYSKNNLKDDNLEIGIASIKHTKDRYPALTTFESKFHEYFKELVFTINCFKKNPLSSKINLKKRKVLKAQIIQVLFFGYQTEIKKMMNGTSEIKSQIKSLQLKMKLLIKY